MSAAVALAQLSLRPLERRVKASIIRIIGRLTRPRAPVVRPDWSARSYRILYVRYDRIGDMVLATGIIKAIVSAQPTITVDVLASRGNAAVLNGNPYVNRVLTVDRTHFWWYATAIAQIRRGRYDAVVDAMVRAPSLTTMILMWASGARYRIGVAERGNDYALTLPVAPLADAVHYVDHSAALLSAFDVDPRQEAMRVLTNGAEQGWGVWRPEIFLTPAERAAGEARWRVATDVGDRHGGRRIRLVANVSAGAGWRYWPDDRFAAALTQVQAACPTVTTMVVGAPQDRDRIERIARAAKAQVTHTGDYRQMMALVASADIAFTADTSVTHIASAFGKPAVVLFGRGRAGLYGPYGVPGRTVSTPGTSLDAIEVEPVVAALEATIRDQIAAEQ